MSVSVLLCSGWVPSQDCTEIATSFYAGHFWSGAGFELVTWRRKSPDHTGQAAAGGRSGLTWEEKASGMTALHGGLLGGRTELSHGLSKHQTLLHLSPWILFTFHPTSTCS